MFLKTLEIRGFKSFADKIELKFKNGVTAVVGPNGSGKSNISDAVRWVLGEQSIKSLRGGKMEDVIFAGTQYRKPLGLAQVSITLDNSDYELPLEYSDVTVSRRLYRSGESEYYINNTQCRLKDIQELFMDTGIGKEGYSIIGQGKIEAILGGRPEERRTLFEEAAGIVKFKTRKEEAEKKLDNTEQNLVRINDILSTYEERLEPLRIENEKAERFLEISNHLKEKEVAVIIHLHSKNEKEIKELESRKENFDKEIYDIDIKKDDIKDNISELNVELEKLDNQNAQEKQEYYSSIDLKQKITANNNVMEERINNLKEYISKYEADIRELKSSLQEQMLRKDSSEKELEINKQKQIYLNEQIKSLENSIVSVTGESENYEKEIENRKNDQVEIVRGITDLKNAVNASEINYDNIIKRQEQIKSVKEDYFNSLKINTLTLEGLRTEESNLHQKINDAEINIQSKRKELQKLTKLLAEKESIYKKIITDSHVIEANRNALINLEKNFEGYNRAVKILMGDIENSKIPQAKNNTFLLGEVIRVESKFETAMETAIGGAISNIITSEDSIAKVLINYLKANRLGRATFLPLNIIQAKKLQLDKNITSMSGYIGVASDLVKYENLFRAAIEYVLGRTIICDTLDNALNIAKKTSYSYRIVTLTGEVVNSGGSLTGGSAQYKGNNIIGRKREIEELGEKLTKVKEEIKILNDDNNKLKNDISKLDNEILNFKDEIHSNEIEITKLHGKISSIVKETDRLASSIKSSDTEMASLDERLKKYTGDMEELKIKIEKFEIAEKNNKDSLLSIQNKLEEKRIELNKIREQHTEFKINKAQIDEIVSNNIRELERMSRELEESEIKIKNMGKDISNSEENINISKDNIELNNSKLKELSQIIEVFEDKFKEHEVQRINLKGNIKNNEVELEDLEKALSVKENEKHKLEITLTKISIEMDALLTRLNEDYKMTIAEAQKYKKDILEEESIKKEIDSLKFAISKLGVVNLGAIEEYKDISEKYSFMNSQKNDLMDAKQELIDVIGEMTSKMKEVFNENFNKLKLYFNETFRELFKGGSADLILGDGDELTAAIDINVQPPGKKLQNINLMSGGEKGLSAIALLFAILKMKPTPFCILDEIEAALDDANVSRYAEFLKSFSGNTQFIVITHRKGTMEASDILYGVTMEEKGVSKIVSVDLNR
ncbi:chromosome segregation protein SMC [Clostridium sp. 19966]|uniref:chromosome segregation protein SMC n=1 Tax=Clostridium sp. 19966 TaxID=2768166 RepID=UPI0028DEA409|nr:chromosome segregation protein SMC [Clostridium sp. 19966]MDT8716449.1 chromosome segregation protein SMC [Clostridium sp. 19966]